MNTTLFNNRIHLVQKERMETREWQIYMPKMSRTVVNITSTSLAFFMISDIAHSVIVQTILPELDRICVQIRTRDLAYTCCTNRVWIENFYFHAVYFTVHYRNVSTTRVFISLSSDPGWRLRLECVCVSCSGSY